MSSNEGSANRSPLITATKEITLALFGILIVWFFCSTVLFFGWLALGITICMFNPSAAVCSDTLGPAINLFYWEMWLKMLNPMTWYGPFLEAMPQ